MLYYLNIPIPGPLQSQVAAFETKWQGSSKSAPHITLFPPAPLKDPGHFPQLQERISMFTSQRFAMPLYLEGLGHFGNKRVIYIPVRQTPQLMSFQKHLWQIALEFLKPRQVDDRFTPHLTLATRLSAQQGEEAWEAAQQTRWDTDFLCTQIQLLSKAPNDLRWNIQTTFPLG